MWLCWLLKHSLVLKWLAGCLFFYLAYELTLPKWGKLHLILLSCFISTALSLVRDGANLCKALHRINIWTTKGGGCGGCSSSCKYKKYIYPLDRPLWQPRSSICRLCECLVPTLSLVNPAHSSPPSFSCSAPYPINKHFMFSAVGLCISLSNCQKCTWPEHNYIGLL